jgi:hypothetical protein
VSEPAEGTSRPAPRDLRSRGDPKKGSRGDPKKAAERIEREKRLAAALRENLRRRKERAHAQGPAISKEEKDKPERSA